jgi:hypothetical protein
VEADGIPGLQLCLGRDGVLSGMDLAVLLLVVVVRLE